MAWNQSAYTAAGAQMLTESLSGRKLSITRAAGGMGVCDAPRLGDLTDVMGEQIPLALLGMEDTEAKDEDGALVPAKRVGVQITNDGLTEPKILHQVGIFGKLDIDEGERLVCVMQDERGIELPSEPENPSFVFELYATLLVSNKSNIVLKVDPSSKVTLKQVEQLLREELEKHDEDPAAHEETIRKAVQAAASGAVQIKDITIPAEGWTQSPGSDEAAALSYTIDLAVEGVTEAVYPSVAVHKAALEAANTAGLCPAVQALAGVLRFWAQTPPKTNLSATAILMTPGNMVGSSAGYVLPVATATRLGGVKIGPGITASPDGTITASNSGIPPEKVVSATDTEKMLDEIFPDNA